VEGVSDALLREDGLLIERLSVEGRARERGLDRRLGKSSLRRQEAGRKFATVIGPPADGAHLTDEDLDDSGCASANAWRPT
jgi:hypothetical protein